MDISTGKILLSLTSAWSGVGSYLFDWNETHIYNPTWPRHAKFHNAQTMSMGAALAAAGLYAVWGAGGPMSRGRLQAATAAASMYWLTQLSATVYPGTALSDTEPVRRIRGPQPVVAAAVLALNAIAYGLESRRLTH